MVFLDAPIRGLRSLWWCLLLCVCVLAGRAGAAPSDVRGSGNVAVQAYTNRSGNFVLWSNGRITSVEGKEVNKEGAYDSYSAAKLPTRITGNILGSPQVAVSSFSNEDATYVLFSDGTVKKPRNTDASAPANQSHSMVCGVDVAEGDSKSGDLGWRCRQASITRAQWQCETENALEIVFNTPFKKRPIFLCTVDNYLVNGTIASNKRIYNHTSCDCLVSASRVYIIGPTQYPNKASTIPWHVTFAAFEEE